MMHHLHSYLTEPLRCLPLPVKAFLPLLTSQLGSNSRHLIEGVNCCVEDQVLESRDFRANSLFPLGRRFVDSFEISEQICRTGCVSLLKHVVYLSESQNTLFVIFLK